MLNLIKMDLHRLFRTKSFKIGLLISAAVAFLAVAVLAGISNLVPMLPPESQAALSALPFANWRNDVNLFVLIITATSALSLMISAVLASNFISDEQSNGYVKNIAGQVKDKGMMIGSKFVALSVITFFVMLVYAAFASLAGLIFFNGALNYDGLPQFLAVFGTKYLIYLAVNAIVLFLCTLSKSKSLSIATGVLFGSGATLIVYNTVSTFAGLILKCELPIAPYTPDGLVFGLSMDSVAGDLYKALAVGAAYIAVFLVLSIVTMKKRDTR